VAHMGQEARLAGALGLGLHAGGVQFGLAGVLQGGVQGLNDQARAAVIHAPRRQKDAAVQRQAGRKADLGLAQAARAGEGGQDGGAVGGIDGRQQPLLEQRLDRQGGGRRAIGGQGAQVLVQRQGQGRLPGQQRLDPGHVGFGELHPAGRAAGAEEQGRGGRAGRHQGRDPRRGRRRGRRAQQPAGQQARARRARGGYGGDQHAAAPAQRQTRRQGREDEARQRAARPAAERRARQGRQRPQRQKGR